MTRIGSLCTGYGGLDMAVESVLGGELAWVADNDEGASKILAHRFPAAKNLGDISETDWSTVEPVDVACMGFPCTNVSCAGGRAGLRAGNQSGVWAYCARAISVLRPPLVVIENVRGLLSYGADSKVEWCPWCLGDTDPESALRAIGAVLGDLADLGFDAEWVLVSANEAGAPHRRERVFILAWPAEDADRPTGSERWQPAPGQAAGGWPRPDAGRPGGARAPDFQSLADSGGKRLEVGSVEHHGPQRPATERSGDTSVFVPSVACGVGSSCDAAGDGRDERRPEPARIVRGPDAAQCGDGPAADPEGDGLERLGQQDGRSHLTRSGSAARAVPAGRNAAPANPDAISGPSGKRDTQQRPEGRTAPAGSGGSRIEWGPYELAITRWERVLGRSAPRPTEPGRTGERLSPRFVEWMMGLPEGWVTDVPGLTRNAQLKALGNGVVPQQAAVALRLLLEAAGRTETGRSVA